MYALLLFMLLYLQLMQNKTCCPDALFPLPKNPLVDLPFFVTGSNTALLTTRITSWDLQSLLCMQPTYLLTLDGLFLFKVVEALWEGTYLPGTLHARKKRWWTKMVVDKMVVI